ncbi:MAG: DUF2344 domain-containing protein, partial [Anaerolineae bacterium]
GTVSRADYAVIVSTDLTPAELSARIAALLDSPEVIQTRIRRQKEETFNLRPLLHSLTLQQISGGKAHLSMQLAAGQHGNLRPGAVLTALGIDNPWYQAERTKLHLTFDS